MAYPLPSSWAVSFAFSWSNLMAILVSSLLISSVAGLTCKEDEHNFNNQRCCRKCPPGEGVVSPCSLTNNTVCEPCTAGVTFSDTLSHQDVCKSCSKCDSVTHVHRTCNVTENTACECNANYFYNVTSEECVACAGCPLGFGASNVCTHHVNTRCRACPNGTFSDRRDHAGCVVCRVCRPGQLLLQSCSTMQNTVCLEIPDGVSSVNGLVVTPGGGGGEFDNTASELIPLYCAIMGAVIIAVIIYVVIKHWRRRKLNKAARKASLDGEAPPIQGSDSGVIIEQQNNAQVTVTSSTFVRDLPAGKRQAVETELNTSIEEESGWAGLAKELGYNTSKIASFEVRAEQDQHTPIRYMLLEWGKSDSATVGVLVHALRHIGRRDIAKVLAGNRDSLLSNDKESV